MPFCRNFSPVILSVPIGRKVSDLINRDCVGSIRERAGHPSTPVTIDIAIFSRIFGTRIRVITRKLVKCLPDGCSLQIILCIFIEADLSIGVSRPHRRYNIQIIRTKVVLPRWN